jgi:hypothetical protein
MEQTRIISLIKFYLGDMDVGSVGGDIKMKFKYVICKDVVGSEASCCEDINEPSAFSLNRRRFSSVAEQLSYIQVPLYSIQSADA